MYRDFLSNHEDLSSVFTHEKAEVGGICLCGGRGRSISGAHWPARLVE